MKKQIFILVIILIAGCNRFKENTEIQSDTKPVNNLTITQAGPNEQIRIDTITAREFFIHKYILARDISEFENFLMNDSISIEEFNGKNIASYWYRTKGRYYWDPYDPLPFGVKWLYRKPTYEGFIEYLVNKYQR